MTSLILHISLIDKYDITWFRIWWVIKASKGFFDKEDDDNSFCNCWSILFFDISICTFSSKSFFILFSSSIVFWWFNIVVFKFEFSILNSFISFSLSFFIFVSSSREDFKSLFSFTILSFSIFNSEFSFWANCNSFLYFAFLDILVWFSFSSIDTFSINIPVSSSSVWIWESFLE